MKAKFFSFFILFLIGINQSSYAQPLDYSRHVRWSEVKTTEEWELNNTMYGSTLLENGDIISYTFKIENRKPGQIIFHAVRSNGDSLENVSLTMQIGNNELKPLSLKYFGNKFCFLAYNFNHRAKTADLIIYFIDKQTLEFTGEYQYIGSIPHKSAENPPRVFLSISHNDNFILVCGQFQEKHVTQASELHAWVYDFNWNLQWRKIEPLPFSSTDTSTRRFWVNNKGELCGYVMKKLDKKWTNPSNRIKDFAHWICKLDHTANPLQVEEIPIDDESFRNLIPGTNMDDELIFIGVFEDPISRVLTHLTFHLYDETELTLLQKDSLEFEDSFLQDDNGYNHVWADRTRGFARIEFDHFISYPEGTLFIGEVEGINTSRDIILTFIDNNGKFSWINKIEKVQSKSGGMNSYFSANSNGETYLIYGEDKRNYDPDTKDKLITYRGGNNARIIMTRIYQNGEMESMYLSDPNDKEGSVLIPIMSDQLEDGKILLFHYDSGRYKIGRLDLINLPKDHRG